MPRVWKRGYHLNGVPELQPYCCGVGKRDRQDAIEASAFCAGVMGVQSTNGKPRGNHDEGKPVVTGEESRVESKGKSSVASGGESKCKSSIARGGECKGKSSVARGGECKSTSSVASGG